MGRSVSSPLHSHGSSGLVHGLMYAMLRFAMTQEKFYSFCFLIKMFCYECVYVVQLGSTQVSPCSLSIPRMLALESFHLTWAKTIILLKL